MQGIFRNCTHILTRTQGKKFEDMFLAKIASKETSLKCFQNRLKFADKYTITIACSLLHCCKEYKLYLTYSGCHKKF